MRVVDATNERIFKISKPTPNQYMEVITFNFKINYRIEQYKRTIQTLNQLLAWIDS